MMKRLLSFLLASVLIFASLSFETDAKADVASYSSEQAELLYALGVFDYSNLENKPVTRAQFVKYAMKLAGIPVTPYNGTEFKDVPKTHSNYDYIMSAVDFGLISIAENFRPEDTISATEAVKIIIHLLGYDFMAMTKGGYPTGYLQTAQLVDLSKGLDVSTSAMSEYDVCVLLYNALKVKLPEVSYTGNGNDYYIGTATILGKYRGILEITGVVDGVSYYSDYKIAGLGEDRISINGTIYNTGSLNCDMLYGYDVTAYYDANAKVLISCTPSDSNRVVSIYAEDIESFTGGVCTYTDEDGRTKSVSINATSTIFYNGRLIEYNSSKLMPGSGRLTFVSANASGVFSTLYIKSYNTIVVNKTSRDDENFIILDKYDSENNLIFNPDEVELVVTDQDGNDFDFSSIVSGDVINTAVSDDGKYIEIISVNDEFMGVYTGYASDYIEVDESEYRLTPSLKNKIDDIISLGKQAIFRLDIDRRIADIIPVLGVGEELGYLVVGRVNKQGLSSGLAVRILNLDGQIYNYHFADSFSINGVNYKDHQKAFDENKSSEYDSLVCSVIKYSLNDEGKIKSIVYPDNQGGNGGLYYTNSIDNATNTKFARYFHNIGNRIVATEQMKLFKVPDPVYYVNRSDDERYSVENASSIYGENSINGYKLVGYSMIPDDGVTQYLLMQKVGDDSGTAEGVVIPQENYGYMVNSIRTVIKEDGTVGEKMELCDKDHRVSSPLVVYSKNENDFSAKGVEPGDVVRIVANEQNVVIGFDLIWKNGNLNFEPGVTDYVSATQISSSGGLRNSLLKIRLAYAYSVRGLVLDAADLEVAPADVGENNIVPLYSPQAAVFKYDKKLGRIVELSVNDIKDYKNFGDQKDTFIYDITYNHLRNIFMVE